MSLNNIHKWDSCGYWDQSLNCSQNLTLNTTKPIEVYVITINLLPLYQLSGDTL